MNADYLKQSIKKNELEEIDFNFSKANLLVFSKLYNSANEYFAMSKVGQR